MVELVVGIIEEVLAKEMDGWQWKLLFRVGVSQRTSFVKIFA